MARAGETAGELLLELNRNARQPRDTLNPARLRAGFENTGRWASGEPHFDHDKPDERSDDEPEKRPSGEPEERQRRQRHVQVVGDPMIIDAEGRKHHYWGSALMVVFTRTGLLKSLEFVACTEDRNYISEVWRLDVATDKYKYRYLEDTPGFVRLPCTGQGLVDGPMYMVDDSSWESQKYSDAEPDEKFLSHFTGSSRTFFINSATGTFMQGPDYGVLQQILEKPVKILKKLLAAFPSEEQIPAWMGKAVRMISESSGYHWCDGDHGDLYSESKPQATMIQNVQTVQFACGLTTSMMMRQPTQVEAF